MHQRIAEMLDKAAGDLAWMKRSRSADESREAWEAFLDHANCAINRLDRPAEKAGRKAEFKALLARIWKDPVAAYMRAARNSREHGMDIVAIPDPDHDRIVLGNGAILPSVTVISTLPSGERVIAGRQVGPTEIEGVSAYQRIDLPASIMLAPVLGSAGYLHPPVVGLESPMEMAHVAIARVYLAWVTDAVRRLDV